MDIKPLQGITVIEIGHSVAAPFAGQILGDLGAEVIKVEKSKGDDARHWGPPFVDEASATFHALNRSKKSVVLDFRNVNDTQNLKKLIRQKADIVLQNMRPGQVQELGLDFESLRTDHQELIYCNIGAFGAQGPLSQKAGYDPLMQAFSGIMSVVGEPGSEPVRVGPSIVDLGTGMWAAMGIISLLLSRKSTGKGGLVDVSLFETAATWMNMISAQYLASGLLPKKNGSGQVGIVPYKAYATKDGHLVVTAGNNELFGKLATLMGHPEWLFDDRFKDNPSRVENATALYALLDQFFLNKSNDQWIELLDAVGLPCAPVQDISQMLVHPQTLAIGLMQTVSSCSIPLMGLPISFNGTRPKILGASPSLGSSNIKDLIH
jgi:crotonobetainyl-CoA:carnitine CoA-transferase CaiB-like acyl-CoA transferase